MIVSICEGLLYSFLLYCRLNVSDLFCVVIDVHHHTNCIPFHLNVNCSAPLDRVDVGHFHYLSLMQAVSVSFCFLCGQQFCLFSFSR